MLDSISSEDSESRIFCFVLANDGQGLLTLSLSLRAAGQACVSWVGPGSGSDITGEGDTNIQGGHNNTSDSIVLTFLNFTAYEVENTCNDLTGEQRKIVGKLTTPSICLLHYTDISA